MVCWLCSHYARHLFYGEKYGEKRNSKGQFNTRID